MTDISDLKVGDIVNVHLRFEKGPLQKHIVPKSDLETFIEAHKRLHHDPGVNPTSREKTAALQEVIVAPFRLDGPYWWTNPDLKSKDANKGAQMLEFDYLNSESVWRSPAYIEQRRQEDADED